MSQDPASKCDANWGGGSRDEPYSRVGVDWKMRGREIWAGGSHGKDVGDSIFYYLDKNMPAHLIAIRNQSALKLKAKSIVSFRIEGC